MSHDWGRLLLGLALRWLALGRRALSLGFKIDDVDGTLTTLTLWGRCASDDRNDQPSDQKAALR